ncbi:MAG: MFS transporter [Firmicutes bacterium]|nr:MFS transporter [Bacillota bacterium]
MKNRSFEMCRWMNWGILAFAFLIVFFHRYSTAVVADDLTRDLGLTGTQLSNLASMYFFAYGLMQLPSGLFSDFVGPRMTTFWGMLLAGVGSIIFGLAPGVGMAYAARLLVGLGVSVIFLSLLKIQAVWFTPNRYATMTGMSSFVGNLGGILATTPLVLLVLAIGWRHSFILIGAITLLLVAAIWLFVVDSPACAGFVGQGNGSARPRFGLLKSVKIVVSTPGTWINFFVIAGLMSGVMSFSGLWGVPYLTQVYGIDTAQASRYVLLLNLGILAGSPLVGWAADKLGSTKLPIVGAAAAVSGFWLYLVVFAGGMPPLVLVGPLYFIVGMLGISFMLCFANTKQVNHPELSGTATGIVNIAGFLATALANVLIGWRLDNLWDGTIRDGVPIYTQQDFQSAFSIYIILALIALVASLFMYETRKESRHEL